jgi:hypothetical protein
MLPDRIEQSRDADLSAPGAVEATPERIAPFLHR